MSTQLTISIELITFMQWVLKYKSDAFAAFIAQTVDTDLREKLIALSQDTQITVSSNKLYETLSNFMRFIEHNLQISGHSDDSFLAARRSKKKARGSRAGSHRHHAPNCTAHQKEVDMNEIQSIQSPTQRVLYEALFNSETNSESGVN
ncbi:MAG: hypothetical protein QG632_449 [Candidatus Dependentiae bacterium]|nr:hypothetical protein [Candidatus Dependentiae bacterium]